MPYKQRQQDRACLRVLAGVFALHPELNPLNKAKRESDQIQLGFLWINTFIQRSFYDICCADICVLSAFILWLAGIL